MTRIKPTPLQSGLDAVGEGRAYGAGEHWYGPPAADAAVDDLFEHLVEAKDLAPGEVARDHAERDTPESRLCSAVSKKAGDDPAGSGGSFDGYLGIEIPTLWKGDVASRCTSRP